jgi:hypothetical protein
VRALTVLVDAEGLQIPRVARDDNGAGIWLMMRGRV